MAATKINNAAAIAACDSVVDLIDGGAGAGHIEIRTGAGPADCDTASNGTLLATLVTSDPAFGNAADGTPGGIATASAITDDSSADATDTAGYFRGFDSDNVCVIQGDVTATSGGGDMELNAVAIVTGAVVSVTAWTVTNPES